MHSQTLGMTRTGMVLSLTVLLLSGITVQAQEANVEGLITGRSGPSMSLKTQNTPRLTVLLSETTKATEKGGFLGLGKKDLGIAALVPGLQIKVEGSYNADHQLVARKITFSRNSLNTAKQIDAGLNPTNEQVAAAQDQLKTDRKNIESAQSDIDSSKRDIASNAQLSSDGLASNKSAIGTANSRFGKLDEYDTKGSITVNFANGKATVSPKDKEQLTQFVKAAADTPGFMIQVQGYASAVGSASLNQRLSAERAEAVVSIIQQSGSVPLTRILAPAAMGTTNLVDSGHNRTAQAQNRRVVVTILINRGITG
jgi:OOP family OmpA-OmpF porin